MTLCEDNHDTICYVGRKCPLCEMRAELKDEIIDLLTEIKKMEEAE